jgi:hypothetical protein
MAARIYRPLKVIELSANVIWRRRYYLSKHLHIDVTLLSKTHLKPFEKFQIIPNYYFYRTGRFPRRKGILHNHVDLCYMCDTYTLQMRSLFIRDKSILSPEKMLHKDYDRKDSVANKKFLWSWTSRARRQDELIGGKPPS